MDSHSVVFRNYAPTDLAQCAKLANEAWPLPPAIAIGVRMDSIIENWVGWEVSSSSYAEVAADEHGVVGMLFGTVEGQPALREEYSSFGIQVRLLLRGLLGSYGNMLRSLRLIASFEATELKLLVNYPRTDARIEMLVVSEAHRGKGLGKELVRRFIETAKKQGAKSLSIYSDDQTSNWRFYEIIGCKLVARFYDNGVSRFADKRTNALIYRFDF